MSARAITLCALLTIHIALSTEISNDEGISRPHHDARGSRGHASSSWSPRGCLYEGRWHASGHKVPARAACLRCACTGGALTCSRRACRPLPDPLPPRCHLLHRKGACCPEMHCPNGVMMTELEASTRLDDDYTELISQNSFNHGYLPACVEGGTVYAAGSAMESPTACEQCFCLRGARRCVRPRCLPPPRGCAPRPAPGACCPQRYYCHYDDSTEHPVVGRYDCKVNKEVIPEGERVQHWEGAGNCTQCFCLRGDVRCQPLSCAPPLHGCTPRLRPGDCCAHQYYCQNTHYQQVADLDKEVATANLLLVHNSLTTLNNEDRSLHMARTTKQDSMISVSSTTTEKISTTTDKLDISSNKVKRKTNDHVAVTKGRISEQNVTFTKTTKLPTTQKVTSAETTTDTEPTTTTSEELADSERTSTDLPEEIVKILINGTINCSTEYSSISKTDNETEQIIKQSLPRLPSIDRMDVEGQTFDPTDIITDRHVNGDFDENETFTINVTSSLSTNNSQLTHEESKPGLVTDLKVSVNSSKKTKEEYDYDYTEPTLPPSLPNLKIIPFVAADAVVEDDEPPPKDSYTVLDGEDKFPVYYPKVEMNTPFATRRHDVYQQNDYPTLNADKASNENEPPITPEIRDESEGSSFLNLDHDLSKLIQEYTLSASLVRPISEPSKSVTKLPTTTFSIQKPSVNLFSPPVETEGGFVPKGPGIIDEYYAVYPSTPLPPHIPHLTTSMQLDTDKVECTYSDGRRIPNGKSITISCSVCMCAWGELHCSPRPCLTPAGCSRRPATTSTADLCCGDLVCDQGNKTTTTMKPISITTKETTTKSDKVITKTTPTEVFTEASTNVNLSKSEDPIITNDNDSSHTNIKNKTIIETTTEKMANTTEKYIFEESSTVTPVNLRRNITENSTIITTITTTVSPIPTANVSTTYESQSNEEETNDSPEYEEEDEGFSFGNVLKLLLSETYDATTESALKKRPTTLPMRSEITERPLPAKVYTPSSISPITSTIRPYVSSPPPYKYPSLATTSRPITTRYPPSYPSVAPFVPLPPHRPPYSPQKHSYPSSFLPTSVNRIDHLVLGEATAIRHTTIRPVSTNKPFTPSSKPQSSDIETKGTRKPYITARPSEITTKEAVSVNEIHNSIINNLVRPTESGPSMIGNSMGVGGLLKLAGCNIYGRMYRVGNIIAELSTPCQECRCTESGVHCKPLNC